MKFMQKPTRLFPTLVGQCYAAVKCTGNCLPFGSEADGKRAEMIQNFSFLMTQPDIL